MGKAFEVTVGSHEDGPYMARGQLGSPAAFGETPKKKNSHSAGVAPLRRMSAWPDPLEAAELYLERIGRSAFLKTDVRLVTTLFQKLVEETGDQLMVPTASIEEVNQVKKCLTRSNRCFSPVQDSINLGSEFSLDGSDSDSDEALLAVPVADIAEEVPASHQAMEHGVFSDLAEQERAVNDILAHSEAAQSKSSDFPELKEDREGNVVEKKKTSSPAQAQLEEIFRGMMKARAEYESGLTESCLRRDGESSRTLSESMSDEAISERASLWGNGVASIVLRNSSRESTPRSSDASSGGSSYSEDIPSVSKHIKDALSSFQLAFLVCDAVDRSIPILYASAGFFHMTGYSAEEVIGRNCRFLQGVDTDKKEVARIREQLKKGEIYTGTLLNYKKDGTPFWNLLTLSPIKDDKGRVIKYIGMQAEVNSSSRCSPSQETLEISNEACSDSTSKPDWLTTAKLSTSSSEVTIPPRPPLFPQARLEREASLPVFSVRSSELTAAEKQEQAKRRQRRASDVGTSAPPVAQDQSRSRSRSSGSRRASSHYSLTSGRVVSIDCRRSESVESRPLTWQAAVRKSAEELRLCPGNEIEEPVGAPKRERAVVMKNRSNSQRVGILKMFWRIQKKVLDRQESVATIPSVRINAFDSDSDGELEGRPEIVDPAIQEAELAKGLNRQLRDIYAATASRSPYAMSDREVLMRATSHCG
uniref:Putative LOV domain-containing protein n=1 Tax=Pellia neesiana TaxID=70144 RepID=A0A126WYC2_PELNE|nr:putative LOV domain-containing protein [Pellia neesiana]